MKTSREPIQLGLAPMEGVTDFAARLWFQLIGGMHFTWTPFMRVTDTYPLKVPEWFAPELTHLKGLFPAPLTVQVMGSRADDIVRTFDVMGPLVEFLDLNCGCPSPTVVGSRAGSSLLERSDIFGAFIQSVTSRVGSRRLSVKMRTGFHDEQEFESLLSVLSTLPLRHLTVHGRTRPQRYTGRSNWSLIQWASDQMDCPVIGSGDLCEFSNVEQRWMAHPRIQSMIVGRGALRNPWIFTNKTSAPVVPALVAFILMQDLFFESPAGLVQWAAKKGDWKWGACGYEDWLQICFSLSNALNRSMNLEDWTQVSPRALSRGKMLWNYMRSSLDPCLMSPGLMRSSSLRDLMYGLQNICTSNLMDSRNLKLKYRADLDWMYSGEGRGNISGTTK